MLSIIKLHIITNYTYESMEPVIVTLLSKNEDNIKQPWVTLDERKPRETWVNLPKISLAIIFKWLAKCLCCILNKWLFLGDFITCPLICERGHKEYSLGSLRLWTTGKDPTCTKAQRIHRTQGARELAIWLIITIPMQPAAGGWRCNSDLATALNARGSWGKAGGWWDRSARTSPASD